MEDKVKELTAMIASKDEMIAMMKVKTKEFVTKLKSEHEEAFAKVR